MGDYFAVKGALIWALVSSPRAWVGVKDSRTCSAEEAGCRFMFSVFTVGAHEHIRWM
jgi:hypothetical protein